MGVDAAAAALAAAVLANPLLAAANATAARRISAGTTASYVMLQKKLDALIQGAFPQTTLTNLNDMCQKDDVETQRVVGTVLKVVFEKQFMASPTGSDETINLMRTALGAMYKGDGPFFGSKNKLSEHDMLTDYVKGAHQTKVTSGGGVGNVGMLDNEQYNVALGGSVKYTAKVRGGRARVGGCARALTRRRATHLTPPPPPPPAPR